MAEHPSPLQARRARLLAAASKRHIPLATILTVAAVAILVYLSAKALYLLRDVVLLVSVGGFVALVLNPQVLALQRWKVPRRGVAVGIVATWSILIFFGLAFAFGYPLVNGLTHLAHTLSADVRRAQHGKGWIGSLVRRYHVEAWVQRNSPKLVSLAEGLGKPALSLGKGAASAIVTLVTTFIFVVLLLVEARKMRDSLLRQLSPARAERWRRIGGDLSRSERLGDDEVGELVDRRVLSAPTQRRGKLTARRNLRLTTSFSAAAGNPRRRSVRSTA